MLLNISNKNEHEPWLFSGTLKLLVETIAMDVVKEPGDSSKNFIFSRQNS